MEVLDARQQRRMGWRLLGGSRLRQRGEADECKGEASKNTRCANAAIDSHCLKNTRALWRGTGPAKAKMCGDARLSKRLDDAGQSGKSALGSVGKAGHSGSSQRRKGLCQPRFTEPAIVYLQIFRRRQRFAFCFQANVTISIRGHAHETDFFPVSSSDLPGI